MAGDLETALGMYEQGAVMVQEPGQLAEGLDAIREALKNVIALKPTIDVEKDTAIRAGDLAITMGKWTFRGTDSNGEEIQGEGASADVLRRQPDGSWLIVIDDAVGTAYLG